MDGCRDDAFEGRIRQLLRQSSRGEPPASVSGWARYADDPQLASVQAGAPEALDQPGKVLARLQRSDGEHVIAVGRLANGRERLADAHRDHPDLFLSDAEDVHELLRRELRDRDHAVGAAHDPGEDAAAVLPRPHVERLRVPQDGEVVDRDDERNR